MKIKPLADRVVIKQESGERVTKSNIILIETNEHSYKYGKVVAVGIGRMTDKGFRIPMELKVGDNVYYNMLRGVEVVVDNEKFVIIREADIPSTI